MRKIFLQFFILVILLSVVSCGRGSETVHLYNAEYEPTTAESARETPTFPQELPIDEATLPDGFTPPLVSAYELCFCGEHYVHEQLRQPTPPMNILDICVDDIAAFGFENIHTVTYLQFETDWYSTIILSTDVPLRDFSFVSLDVAGHYWYDDRELIIHTREELFSVPKLYPTDAVVLRVAFAHYLLPHGAIIFTDETYVRRRMFIRESMRGGCFPLFHLGL